MHALLHFQKLKRHAARSKIQQLAGANGSAYIHRASWLQGRAEPRRSVRIPLGGAAVAPFLIDTDRAVLREICMDSGSRRQRARGPGEDWLLSSHSIQNRSSLPNKSLG